MRFQNYLKNLSENEYVNNESPICMWGLENILNKMYLEIKEKHNSSMLKLISSELGVKSQNCRAFYHWIKDGVPIPISKFLKLVELWRITCKKSSKDASMIIQKAFTTVDYFSTKRGKKAKLPKVMTLELAYLIGFISGDGHLLDPIKEKKRTGYFEFRLEITDEKEYVLKNYVNTYLKKIFDLNFNIYKYKNRNAYEYYITSKVLFLFLNKIVGLPEGKKGGRLHIPKIILNSNSKIKSSYLKGFFDSDGFVTTNKKVGFNLGKTEKPLLKEINLLFNQLEINTRKITETKGWEPSISWGSLYSFIDRISSNNPEKLIKLNNLREGLMPHANQKI